jgi:hypothetical protein
MVSPPTPATNNVGPAAADITASHHLAPQQPPLNSSQPRHPIQREGAFRIERLTEVEQALEDAMNRSSSPPPEDVLGKRTREEGEPGDGNDTEPDEEGTSRTSERGTPTARSQSSQPSISNITASTLRYASKKKLRPEQRDELDTFLLVSLPWTYLGHLCLIMGQDTALGRQAKLFACVLALENKVETIRSAAPPYQLSDELKVRMVISSYSTPSLIPL